MDGHIGGPGVDVINKFKSRIGGDVKGKYRFSDNSLHVVLE